MNDNDKKIEVAASELVRLILESYKMKIRMLYVERAYL